MPISNKTGVFIPKAEMRVKINVRRSMANTILRLAKEHGIQNNATKRAEADLVEAEKLEKEYFQ